MSLFDDWCDCADSVFGNKRFLKCTEKDDGRAAMRVIEDAFVYRLVWAIEAIRMQRRIQGISSDIIEGGAAATVETGLPRAMMAMLVRAGLPSRVAAMAAINDTLPIFITT